MTGKQIPCPHCGGSVAVMMPVTLRALVPTADEKVALAKRLLIDATIQTRAAIRAARDADLCTCGHRRDEHAVSHSINYTEGFCMTCPDAKDRACGWFNFAGGAA